MIGSGKTTVCVPVATYLIHDNVYRIKQEDDIYDIYIYIYDMYMTYMILNLHFSICACHPCAGAMLIFSVSFQFQRMIPEGNPTYNT